MRLYYNRAAKVKYRKLKARERAKLQDTTRLNPYVVATYRKLREEFRAKLYAAKQDVKVYEKEIAHLNKMLKGRRGVVRPGRAAKEVLYEYKPRATV